MIQKFPICFEAHLKDKIGSISESKFHIFAYETLLNSLTQACDKFVFSLRHLYTPLDKKKLSSFILINPIVEIDNSEKVEIIEGLIKGSLNRFYNLTYKPEGFPQHNWVTSISEMLKYGEFIKQPEFTGYLPHLFSTELITNNFNLLKLLEATSCENLILDFSLEAYNSPKEQAGWNNAINDLVNCLSDYGSKSNSVKYALELYRNYQDNYSENQLFHYSIKALGENTVDTIAILQTLGEIVGSKKKARRILNLIPLTLSPEQPSFIKSLDATKNVQIFKGMQWDGWEKRIGKNLEKKLIKETVKSSGFLCSLDDGSLSFPILPSNLGQFNQSYNTNRTLPNPSESIENQNSGDLTLGKDSSLSKIFETQIPKVEHLKPLHHITTYQEVVGFFQAFSPGVSSSEIEFFTTSAEEIFFKHHHLITKDTYIVGLDDNKKPITSHWTEIPHRLIAGETGAGKTNFLHWIIFQFLYVNPQRKVYIADFKGTDFLYLQNLDINVEIIDTPEDSKELVEKIYAREYVDRLNLMKKYGVSSLKLLQEEGVDIDRSLWVIDEAADIADFSYKLRESIEKRLKEYARKGRTFGIHVLYCTQRPTTEVVTKQVTDQCGEKTVFRVTPDASQRILDDTVAGTIPKNVRGRAWLDGYAGRMFVNVPKMKKPEGSTIPIEDTLWHHFISK
ncbi:hypothetical protein IQ249_11730 [Lusitaniella coriacea LEGE 07157]|uniref:FtsK domain-containing protein n=1 Tax=Lusitaniella coriacea LEGE 07157 TaxID=945747 RepID=A0A8J7DX59_9CYAN|nr:FtsK/SpoIIIE domain-containing protein [Lusitaniella coriacea]MBE9116570.1 hypothetical protein [Lusitaniella coriacea LEGE 07157]